VTKLAAVRRRFPIGKRWVLPLSLGSVLFSAVVSKRVYEMSAAPLFDKPGDFQFPLDTTGQQSFSITAADPDPHIEFVRRGGFINDASHLNRTPIYGIVRVKNEDDVRRALAFAKANKLKVTCAGEQHSMGGQSFSRGGVVLDFRDFNHVTIDRSTMRISAQSGARWWQVQKLLNEQGLAVKSMQSINIFSIGGTLSINAHGIDPDPGPVAPTVRAVRVMLSDGSIVRATPTDNAELFRHVLGGYGLFGVILDAELDVVPNEVYTRKTVMTDYRKFSAEYLESVEGNKEVGLAFGRLSVSPRRYLQEVVFHKYEKVAVPGEMPPLEPMRHDAFDRFVINLSKTGAAGRWVRWNLEKHAEPHLHSCTRNQAMSGKEVCVVSRNQEMYDDMAYLKNRLNDTDILQEYFVPYDRMPAFIDALRTTVTQEGANLLNVTIRTVHKDSVTALPYAKADMFAFVFYFNVGFNKRDNETLRNTTSVLIDAAIRNNGTFYLPYQLYYSGEQLRAAYPEIDDFFETKRKFDPDGLFTNKFYEKYAKPLAI
jgi:FAD/FMN-containing dehydrogenase